MTASLATRYAMRVPRYTSYPTAPHFSDAVDADVYRGWLAELEPAQALSLYFHIPFCDTLCWFCGCTTKTVKKYKPVGEFLDLLMQEIDLVAEALPGRFQARHLHWGGGSPTMVKAADWQRLFDCIRARFDLAEDAEIAVEIDPRDMTEDDVSALAAMGVNRASIGVQDFDPVVQKAVNRLQPFEVTRNVVDWLRRYGIDALNMDLMYGLPHQTARGVTAMVEKAVALRPHRVALFGYAHVPWMKPHQKNIDEGALPGVAERWEQYSVGAARLLDFGYVPIGFDHFALSDDGLARASRAHRLRRNFQGYTVDDAPILLGFGASAIGSLPQGHVQNAAPLKDYRRAIEKGGFATVRGTALSAEDRLRREIIERLMTDMAADLDAICARHGASAGAFATELESVARLEADGLVAVDGHRMTITDQGRPFVRLVAAAFDAYLAAGQARHSQTV